MFAILIIQLLQLVRGRDPVNRFNHTSLLAVITNVLKLTVLSQPAVAVYIKIRDTQQRMSHLPA